MEVKRELLEQAKNLLSRFMPDNFRDQDDQIEINELFWGVVAVALVAVCAALGWFGVML